MDTTASHGNYLKGGVEKRWTMALATTDGVVLVYGVYEMSASSDDR